METEFITSELTKKVIDVTYSKSEVKNKLEEKYDYYGPQIDLPGFRPGKVPKKVIKARFKEPIHKEVTSEFAKEAFENIKDENDFKIIGEPEIDYSTLEEGSEFEITFTLEVEPEIEVTEYEGLVLEAPEVEVTDEDVEEKISQVRRNYSEWVPVEREVREGDVVTIEYGMPDSEETNEEDIYLEEDNEEMLDDFVGKEIGDRVDLELKEEMDVQIVDLKEVRLNELDEKLFKRAGYDVSSYEEFREEIRKELEDEADKVKEDKLSSKAIDKLLEKNPIEVPPSYVENVAEQSYSQYSHLEDLPDEEAEQLKDKIWDDAEDKVGARLLLERVAGEQDISVEKEELKEQVAKMAEQYGTDAQSLFNQLRSEDELDSIKKNIRIQKALQFVVDNANIIEKEKEDK